MFLKNLTPNHVSLFNGGLVIRRGATEQISKVDADSREVTDAVRRGWVKLLSELEGKPVAPEEIPEPPITDPATENTMSAEDLAAEFAGVTEAPKPKVRKKTSE